jgi:hypothetical protein
VHCSHLTAILLALDHSNQDRLTGLLGNLHKEQMRGRKDISMEWERQKANIVAPPGET